MMVFNGLLKTSSNASPRRVGRSTPQDAASIVSLAPSSPDHSPSHEPQEHPYLREKGHLLPVELEPPDLRELNHSLEALAAIFPDVQVEVFREMLSTFDHDSRLAVVTESLLKHKMKYVRGRYRVVSKDKAKKGVEYPEQSNSLGVVLVEDKFRSTAYKKAVKVVAYQEFKGLSRSTINAVLAEFNHSYTLARPTLIALSSKSWRFRYLPYFCAGKTIPSQEAEHHPLVIWRSTGQGSITPSLKATESPELDRELFETLIVPIRQRIVADREEKDHALAVELNNKEAETNEALQTVNAASLQQLLRNYQLVIDGGHFICFTCVRHSVNEATFGQGWQRNIDLDSGTLRCVAAMSGECKGCIPQELVRRAFDQDKSGKEVLRKLDERLAEDNLLKTNLPLIRCPFCSYAEIDELYIPESQRVWLIKRIGPSSLYTLMILILGVGLIPFLLPVFILLSFLFLLVSSQQTFGDFAVGHFKASVTRVRRKRHGLKFVCQNEDCGRPSCISCSKAWTDIHICHESSLLALRTQVELAMSLAIKRTCPRCNTSFVKSSGCNKLTCVCGYQMCYVCRKDIGSGEGYRHFCEHFRPNGGRSCTECSKCDLYRCEDDGVVVKKAKEEAERQWMEKEGTDLGDEKIRKVLEGKLNGGEVSWWDGWWWQWKVPNFEHLIDALVEAIVK